jgi:hypothetical protein
MEGNCTEKTVLSYYPQGRRAMKRLITKDLNGDGKASGSNL